ncbi:hypothetical protein DL767_004303 [Monosporascus sp. MG133]|nr:hypothetical protein DL767_004303 [Monosporascus sp. MG133]
MSWEQNVVTHPVAAAASAASVDLLLSADNTPDWTERDKKDPFFWINVDRDVAYLGDAACHWLSPFASGRDGSVAFEGLPPWFPGVQELVLRLPRAGRREWGSPSCLAVPPPTSSPCATSGNLAKWRLLDLKTLYPVGFRDPECEHCVPCG